MEAVAAGEPSVLTAVLADEPEANAVDDQPALNEVVPPIPGAPPQANSEDDEPALNEAVPPIPDAPSQANAEDEGPALNEVVPPAGEPPEVKAGDGKELENAVGEVNAGVNNEIEDEPDDKKFVFSRELKGVHDPLRPGDRYFVQQLDAGMYDSFEQPKVVCDISQMNFNQIKDNATICYARINACQIVAGNLIRAPLLSGVMQIAENISYQGYDMEKPLHVVEINIDALGAMGLVSLHDMVMAGPMGVVIDIDPRRRFLIVDGGHRLCAVLHLVCQNHPGFPLAYKFLKVRVYNPHKCSIRIVANEENIETSTSVAMSLIDQMMLLRVTYFTFYQ